MAPFPVRIGFPAGRKRVKGVLGPDKISRLHVAVPLLFLFFLRAGRDEVSPLALEVPRRGEKGDPLVWLPPKRPDVR